MNNCVNIVLGKEEITLKINSKIKENNNVNNRYFNEETNKIFNIDKSYS